jgi:hypothetical protein
LYAYFSEPTDSPFGTYADATRTPSIVATRKRACGSSTPSPKPRSICSGAARERSATPLYDFCPYVTTW